jgi:protein O-mannosyl-transferase
MRMAPGVVLGPCPGLHHSGSQENKVGLDDPVKDIRRKERPFMPQTDQTNSDRQSLDPVAAPLSGSDRTERLLAMFLIVVITCAVYFPVVNQQFAQWDDLKFINMVWKPGWERAWAIVSDFTLSHKAESYYNPLHLLSLMFDQALVGASESPVAWIAKLMNVLYHVLNALLVYLLLFRIVKERIPAFVGALIFALHPVQVGTVAWVAERKNLLCAFFYLGAVIAFLQYLKESHAKYLVLVVICFIAGLLSKPSAVTLPVVLAGLVVVTGVERFRCWPVCALIGGLTVFAVFWGMYVMSTELTVGWLLPPLTYRPMLAAGAIWFYVEKFLVPINLSPIYPRWELEPNLPIFVFLLVALLASLSALAYFRQRINKWALWGVFFFLANLALTIGLVPFGYMSHTYVADHFMYLPMVGVVLVCAAALKALLARFPVASVQGKVAMGLIYGWICLLGGLSIHQTWLWRNPTSMWEATLKGNPESIAAHNNYGLLCLEKGDLDKAEALFKRAAELAPAFEVPYLNLGRVAIKKNELEQARMFFARAAQLNSKEPLAFIMQGRVLRQLGRNHESTQFFEAVVQTKPQSAELHCELGLSYYNDGDEDKAIEEFKRSMELAPFLAEPYFQYGAILLGRGEIDKAIGLLEKSAQFSGRAETHNVLGAAYAQKGDLPRALKEFYTAFKIQPNFPGLIDNLANALVDNGRNGDAKRLCAESDLQGKPCSEETLKRLTGGQ